MGKIVQIKSSYNGVSLPPDNRLFSRGDVTSLTSAEYAGLTPGTLAALTVLGDTRDPDRATLYSRDVTLINRYGGGKSAIAQSISTSGTTTLRTPAAGNLLIIYWVQAMPDPLGTGSPLITVALGATTLYSGYGISHWERFEGDLNDALTVTLDASGTNVAVTIHYMEVSK